MLSLTLKNEIFFSGNKLISFEQSEKLFSSVSFLKPRSFSLEELTTLFLKVEKTLKYIESLVGEEEEIILLLSASSRKEFCEFLGNSSGKMEDNECSPLSRENFPRKKTSW